MIYLIGYFAETVFLLANLGLFFFCVSQIQLSFLYLRSLKNQDRKPEEAPNTDLPLVTIQLPVYNERHVICRLIDAAAQLDYPADKMEIQVLDDSDDETVALIADRVQFWKSRGINIFHMRRGSRKGFKAGALQYGLETAKGEFIAIFDADFIPTPDFLHKTLGLFSDRKTGMVQTRWAHLNKSYSLLTRIQAFALDAHFTVEQQGRNSKGYCMNFNGTAGIWRKSCMLESGGWEADTLTEDLDLSYRAQIRGWNFKFLGGYETPGELPVTMPSLKSQQFRWTKGPVQVAKKNLAEVFKSGFSFGKKLSALFHLLNSSVFIVILLSALSSLILVPLHHSGWKGFLPDPFFSASLISLASLMLFYGASKAGEKNGSGFFHFLKSFLLFPFFLTVVMGLSLHNAFAALEGWLGIPSSFIRTPKFGIIGNQAEKIKSPYHFSKIPLITWLEGLLCLLFIWAVYTDLQMGNYQALGYHVLLTAGFGTVFWYSLKHSLEVR